MNGNVGTLGKVVDELHEEVQRERLLDAHRIFFAAVHFGWTGQHGARASGKYSDSDQSHPFSSPNGASPSSSSQTRSDQTISEFL